MEYIAFTLIDLNYDVGDLADFLIRSLLGHKYIRKIRLFKRDIDRIFYFV